MDLNSIVDDIADRADDFLEGATSREQAQAGVSEMITANYPGLAGPERAEVIKGVMAILEEEGFFDHMRSTASGSGQSRPEKD